MLWNFYREFKSECRRIDCSGNPSTRTGQQNIKTARRGDSRYAAGYRASIEELEASTVVSAIQAQDDWRRTKKMKGRSLNFAENESRLYRSIA